MAEFAIDYGQVGFGRLTSGVFIGNGRDRLHAGEVGPFVRWTFGRKGQRRAGNEGTKRGSDKAER